LGIPSSPFPSGFSSIQYTFFPPKHAIFFAHLVLLRPLFFKFCNVDLCNWEKINENFRFWYSRLNHKNTLNKFLNDPRYISGHLATGSVSVCGGKGRGVFRYYLLLAATYVGSYFLKDEALKDSCCLRRMQDEAERRNADVWPAKRRLSPCTACGPKDRLTL
jgi:hypothetical protein